MFRQLTMFILLVSSLIQTTFARSYPIKEIIKDNCSENCTFPLPVIQDADYQNYRSDSIYRSVYSVLRGATYFDGWAVGAGGHQGTDIATAEGTPVYSISTGKVIMAAYLGAWGNTIVIEHQFGSIKLYSAYSHLSEISVKVGEIMAEGALIGKVGSTGNSTGPHLHLQIGTNQDGKHPFFYRGCQGDIGEIVNGALCQSQMYQNTVDPILFLEKDGKLIISQETPEEMIINNMHITGFSGGIIHPNEVKIIDINQDLVFSDFTGTLDIKFNKNLDIFPNSFELIGKTRKIFVTPLKEGISKIEIFYHDQKLAKIFVFVTKNPKYDTPKVDALLKKLSRIYK